MISIFNPASTAFLMSKIHRQDDFLWSGVGLFYALVLWYCARNITGAVLLGQAAATVLVVSYSWQTIKLRRIIANPASANETNNFSLLGSINGLLKRQKPKVQSTVAPIDPTNKDQESKAVVTEKDIAIPETPTKIQPETPEAITDTNTSDANNQVQVQDAQPVEETAKTTPDNQDHSPQPRSKISETPSQPLPSKLPEVADQATTKPEEKEIAQSTTEDVENSSVATVENQQTDIADKTADKKTNNISEPEAEPISKTTTPETTKSASQFDTLETIEVAEVLEAESDHESNKRNLEQSNIIEVTTTEISVTTEVQKTDQNLDSNPEQKEE